MHSNDDPWRQESRQGTCGVVWVNFLALTVITKEREKRYTSTKVVRFVRCGYYHTVIIIQRDMKAGDMRCRANLLLRMEESVIFKTDQHGGLCLYSLLEVVTKNLPTISFRNNVLPSSQNKSTQNRPKSKHFNSV